MEHSVLLTWTWNTWTTCNTASVVQLVAKIYPRGIESVNIEKFKFELDKFLELIPDEPKMRNYVTASGSNSILDQLTHLRASTNLPKWSSPRLDRNHSKYPSNISMAHICPHHENVFRLHMIQ